VDPRKEGHPHAILSCDAPDRGNGRRRGGANGFHVLFHQRARDHVLRRQCADDDVLLHERADDHVLCDQCTDDQLLRHERSDNQLLSVPVTTYYAPSVSVPVTTYYAPASVPVTTYYAAPVTTYYAPTVTTTYYSPYVVRPKVYVTGQPVRNVLRAVTP
jgi:hypothetical protein